MLLLRLSSVLRLRSNWGCWLTMKWELLRILKSLFNSCWYSPTIKIVRSENGWWFLLMFTFIFIKIKRVIHYVVFLFKFNDRTKVWISTQSQIFEIPFIQKISVPWSHFNRLKIWSILGFAFEHFWVLIFKQRIINSSWFPWRSLYIIHCIFLPNPVILRIISDFSYFRSEKIDSAIHIIYQSCIRSLSSDYKLNDHRGHVNLL